jgi:hypothetical protein
VALWEERRVFTEEAVSGIEHRDSTWNGNLLGGGAGLLILVGGLKLPACSRSANAACYPLLLSPFVGVLVGELVDAAWNRPLYVAPGRRSIRLSPVIGPARLGLAATIQF